MDTIDLAAVRDEAFLQDVERESGQRIASCYQCGNCTAGCPCDPVYDRQVNQIMRAVQLGDKRTALECRSLTLCVSCSTCSSRCPNNIDVAKVMDTLRHMSIRYGLQKNAITTFWGSFLQTVRHCGRSYELGVMALFMLRTGRLWTDLDLVPRILPKQKLPFIPHRIVGRGEVSRIFSRFDAMLRAECAGDVHPASAPPSRIVPLATHEAHDAAGQTIAGEGVSVRQSAMCDASGGAPAGQVGAAAVHGEKTTAEHATNGNETSAHAASGLIFPAQGGK